MVVKDPPPRTAQAPSRKQSAGPALPIHVAIIMDGNGRWARSRGLSRQAGHRAGVENIRRVIEALAERGVKYLTLDAFSTENWGRPRREVNYLLRLIGPFLDRELAELHANGIRLLHIGSLEPLSGQMQQRIREAIELTRENDRMTLCMAFNYGGRADVVQAVRRIIDAGIPSSKLTESLFASYLYTAGMPDPDLVIRTAGEMRLSNFLLWQAAYAEYYSTPTYWPDFDAGEVERALEAYAHRGRRFGGLGSYGGGPAHDAANGSSA